jgi:hypothetical protein
MRFAPGVRPTPMPAAPARPGLRPMGSAPMTGGPKPAPQVGAMNNMLAGRPPGGVPAPQAGAMNNMLAGKPPGGMKKGGKVSSASKRADGCAIKGKTKGRMV